MIINKKRDRLVLGLLLIMVLILAFGVGHHSQTKEAEQLSSESSEEALVACMVDSVLQVSHLPSQITLTSVETGEETQITLPLRSGKYTIRVSDSEGECSHFMDEASEARLKEIIALQF